MPTTKKKRQQAIAKGQQKKVKENKSPREVIYQVIEAIAYVVDSTVGPITADKAKELLGWQEEEEKNPFGHKHVAEISRSYGVKVRCNNNVTNRPIYGQVVETLKQEILRGRWRFNGEPIIVGSTGLILNGQHTLFALILAVKEWAEHPERWPHWTEAPYIEKLVCYGVEEDDAIVNTMDTCKPRTLMDVIYRADYFKDLPAKAHKSAARMTQYAIKLLWLRTGTHSNAFAVRATHAESVAFLNNHPQLVKAVQHIYEEDSEEGRISKYISPGYAAAALFLMACSDSNAEEYYSAETPTEELLDWGKWDRACEFFVELGGQAAGLKAVRDEIAKLISDGSTRWLDRWAVFAKAWEPYSNGKAVTAKAVALEFVVKEDERQLVEEPVFGGIDVGEEGLNLVATEEIEERKEAVATKKHGTKKAKKAGKEWAKGDTAWVHPNGGDEPFFAELTDDPFECADSITRVFVDAEDGNYEVELGELSLAQFEKK